MKTKLDSSWGGVTRYISINVQKVVLVTLVGVFTGLPALGFGETVLRGGTDVASITARILDLERQRSLGDGELAKYLDSPDVAIATRAALAIGRTKQAVGVAPLLAHLTVQDLGERAMVVYALGLLGSAEALGAVRDKSEAVRFAAWDAAARIAAAVSPVTPWVGADLTRRDFTADDSPLVRGKIAAAFAAFSKLSNAPQAASILADWYAREHDSTVRWHIMWAIFRGYAKDAPLRILAQGLKDTDETVRIAAVRAYGRRKPANAKVAAPLITAMKKMTTDPSWRVQEQAMESLRVLQGGKLTDHLTKLATGLHLPPIKVQNYMEIAPLPRPAFTGKPAAPGIGDARSAPALAPSTAALMNGPMPGLHPRVRIKTTKGTIVLRLFPEWAALTVANFLNLTNRGYYDGNRWFRIVPDFVVQTGDPSDNGEGDAGFMIGAEENPIEQRTGIVSMGLNYNDKGAIRDSAGTQFYITISPQLHLNSDFTVFGDVESGFDVIARLIESDRMTRVEQIADD